LIQKFDSVVLVDDDEISNLLTKDLFVDMNISREVFSFTDPRVALDHILLVKLANPDSHHLLIIDFNMPEMSGEEFLSIYNKLPMINKDRNKIILLSALIPTQKHNHLKTLGVDEFIEKPLLDSKINLILKKLGIGNVV
jgi:response regulator RpfG family c-di-GMP phosphodiesterase